MPDPLAAAKTFMSALETKDAEKAASVCADDVAIELPGGENQIEGKDGARQLIRMAPPFVRIVREEQVEGNVVILKGLTRSPGHFANYTTWTFETAAPNGLRRAGLSKNGFFEVGKTYTVIGYPARDGSPIAFVEQITLPDGRTIRIWFGDPNGSN